jgi:hypothetical protein
MNERVKFIADYLQDDEPFSVLCAQAQISRSPLVRAQAQPGPALHLLRYVESQPAGAVEGLKGKVRVITKRACGFRTYRAVEVAPITTLGPWWSVV